MRKFAEACERIAGASKKLEKIAIVADYLKWSPPEGASVAAVFLSGRPFPAWEETTFPSRRKVTLESGRGPLREKRAGTDRRVPQARRPGRRSRGSTRSWFGHGHPIPVHPGGGLGGGQNDEDSMLDGRSQCARSANCISRGSPPLVAPPAKATLLRELLLPVTPLEAKYIIKIITGDLRIGLKESLVEEAIAKAFRGPGKRRAAGQHVVGDIGETLRFAAEGKLNQARMRLFHPLGFMLASPAQSAEEALSYFENALVEDKYDGIRARRIARAARFASFRVRGVKSRNLFPNCPTRSLDFRKTQSSMEKSWPGAILLPNPERPAEPCHSAHCSSGSAERKSATK